ncbi:MAG: M23 family metallopeptidase [Zoogloea sp.]|nr:M23 family metallopeptidase [Zoogloea sp.]
MPHSDPVPGGVAVIRVADAAAPRPALSFRDRPVLAWRAADGWYAAIGLPLDLPLGRQTLTVGASREIGFDVLAHDYPSQHLKLKSDRMVNPPPEDMARIEKDQETTTRLKAQWRDVPVEAPSLSQPAAGRLSSRFGLRRFFNGEPRSPHSGLDVAVPTGTRVNAPADGVIAWTGDLFFNGRTVFIDHGQGLISMVCHLSSIGVKEGQTVRRGEEVARSGSTGRATAPHLHWSVILGGTAVNPEDLLAPK